MKFPWSGRVDRPESLIAEGASFRGNIVARGAVHVQGRVDGDIRSEESVVVGHSGHVAGDIWGRVVTIGGTVSGRVEATERAELLSGARLAGDIHAPAVAIEAGAVFEGSTHMGVASAEDRTASRRGGGPGTPEAGVQAGR